MDNNKKFVNGLIVKRHPKAPDFVICALSFKVDDLTAFLNQNQKGGWVNADVKLSHKGCYYCEINEYDKNAPREVKSTKVIDNTQKDSASEIGGVSTQPEGVEDDINPADIPF